ncbi:MAG: glycine--tRNA ligase subunit beta [Anaerolineales bacterium]|uniref:glycine--tRNA ligase subunit beta n=1 Tax=Candidatus Villigracilis vicinus TaxID=3140679 RepID=UPI0031370090|nr:glycine--tRNA ligase subunit beta [Anaerolineales bacterium]
MLEIGVEELPADDVDTAYQALSSRVPTLLKELNLTHGDVRIFTTPRRLVVSVASLSPNQPDREDLVKGPPADKAIGQRRQAHSGGVGFAKKNNNDPLEVREEGNNKYIFALVKQTGRPTPEVLAEALPKLVADIKFEKSMRWNESAVAFSRPIRWYVALLGDMVIPFEYAGVVGGNVLADSARMTPLKSRFLPLINTSM